MGEAVGDEDGEVVGDDDGVDVGVEDADKVGEEDGEALGGVLSPSEQVSQVIGHTSLAGE